MNWNNVNLNNLYANDKNTIVWMQRQLGVKDDGIIGSKTIKALQRMVGTKDDGKWGNNSRTAAIQHFNMHQIPQDTSEPKSMLQRSSTSVRSFFVPSDKSDVISVTGVNDTPQTKTQQLKQTEPTKQSNTQTKQNSSMDDVPTMSMGEYLYRSGNTGGMRRLGNLISVGSNLVSGMINPNGNNASLSEGGRRQMVGASLHHYDKTGKYAITDTDHQELGGMSGHSGSEFRQDAIDSNGQRQNTGTRGYISQAMDSPYHNIFGQSGYTSASGERFSPTTDGYTFNNVWNGNNVTSLQDGEGDMSLKDSIKAGKEAYTSGSGMKAAIETAASQRGVNVAAGRNTYVDEKQMDKYRREYEKYLAMSPEKRAKINEKFGYTK